MRLRCWQVAFIICTGGKDNWKIQGRGCLEIQGGVRNVAWKCRGGVRDVAWKSKGEIRNAAENPGEG